ncbi:MAG: FliM/FliN family flagellar motor switch protein [Pseudomonadota bacterium]|nr:FliM/FliN family flagellar motor switch protein [Pseudomonadota bacterium]
MKEVVVAQIDLEEVDYKPGSGGPLVERNLGVLGHVKVRLDVLMGSAHISVDRLFSLTRGDCVELDADLDAPVALLLDGKPIARGHLMATGDCFGLKISEIL